jgi:hypothetical protein
MRIRVSPSFTLSVQAQKSLNSNVSTFKFCNKLAHPNIMDEVPDEVGKVPKA